MASLLDVVLAQRNPQMAGLLGRGPAVQQTTPAPAMPAVRSVQSQQPAPAPAASGPSFLDRLGSIFGDTPETRREAMLLAGLSLVGNRGHDGPGLGQAIIAGRSAAQASAEKRAEKALQEQIIARRTDIIGSTDLNDPMQRTSAVKALLEGNDLDGAKMLLDIEARFPELKPIEAGDEVKVFDPRTGEFTEGVRLPEPPKDTELRDAGTKILLIDKQTGDVISEFAKTMAPEDLAKRAGQIFDQTNALADDFRSETSHLQESLQMGEIAQGAPADAAGDQTMVIAYNKLLDPPSVVREGEFDRTARIGGFHAQAQQFANRILADGRLSEDARAALQAEIKRMFAMRQQQLTQIAEQYIERANAAGVNPDFVVRRGIQPVAPAQRKQDELTNILGF